MSITLFLQHSGGPSETFTESKKDLKAEGVFKKATVTAGTWILYTYPNYKDAQLGGNPNNYKILEKGKEASIDSVNGSMYLVESATEGIILFEHSYYGGRREVGVARVKPRLNRKTSRGHVTSAGICFSVTITLC